MDNKILAIAMVLLIFLFFLIIVVDNSESAQCLREKDAKNEYLNGKLIDVYMDRNHHNYPTLVLLMEGQKKVSHIFLFEKGGCFGYLQPGDSVVKNPGSLVMEVFRGRDLREFVLNYGCQPKK